MSPDDASTSLYARLRGAAWLTAVGVGEHDSAAAVYVYVRSRIARNELAFLEGGWMGYPVIIEQMGNPRPIHVFSAPPS